MAGSGRSKRLVTTATVEVTLAVPTSVWGAECTAEQITRQAKDEAVIIVRNLVGMSAKNIRILDDPRVKAVSFEEEI